MSLLLRLLETPRSWQQMIKEGGEDAAIHDPPPWAVREFTPSARDEAGLSVFEIDDPGQAEATATVIAGAFAFHRYPVEQGHWVFVGIDRAAVEAADLTIQVTTGGLLHKTVDAMHREIVVGGADQILRAARLFLGSTLLFSVEGKQAAEAARNAARSDELNYLKLHKQSQSSDGGRNLVRFVSEQIVKVTGVPSPITA